MSGRCDNCGQRSRRLRVYDTTYGRARWRICDRCVHRIARGIAMYERVLRRRAA